MMPCCCGWAGDGGSGLRLENLRRAQIGDGLALSARAGGSGMEELEGDGGTGNSAGQSEGGLSVRVAGGIGGEGECAGV